MGQLCGSAEALGGFWGEGLMLSPTKTPPRFSLVMTRSDDHLQDAVPSQKLELVTPKISLMGAGATEGNKFLGTREGYRFGAPVGPS